MFALAFDFDVKVLRQHYLTATGSTSWTNAYKAVRDTLTAWGFTWVQGSVYHLDSDDMGVLFLGLQDLAQISWFSPSIRDIRAYRIELWSNFTPVMKGMVSKKGPKP